MSATQQLDLRPGDWVEVRSEAEILATLDDRATLDELPFMPEMLAHCGQRYQVFKRADKTCDTVTWTGVRRMVQTVHLEMLRCDGSVHGGCQAGCLLFWKEAWLRRASPESDRSQAGSLEQPGSEANGTANRDRAWLEETVYRLPPSQGEPCFRCQATQVVEATSPLPFWEPTQYIRDVCSNREPLWEVLRGLAFAAVSKVTKKLSGHSFPNIKGMLKRTPTESLGLQPGEWVEVKSKEEILATLDTKSCNRGMTFDIEMLPYCGKRFRVLRRVDQIIEESTGRMMTLPGVCIILDNVVCRSRYRRACPRSIYPYWREIWLKRVPAEAVENTDAEPCPLAAALEKAAQRAEETGATIKS